MLLVEKGIFASYRLHPVSVRNITAWANSIGLKDIVPENELHVTTTVSTVEIPYSPSSSTLIIDPTTYKIKRLANAVTLSFTCKALDQIHKAALSKGAVSPYSSFIPHLTLSYNADQNLEFLYKPMVPDFPIVLTHETIAPLRETEGSPANVTANVATSPQPIVRTVLRHKKLNLKRK